MGKTSLLTLVQNRLLNQDNTRVFKLNVEDYGDKEKTREEIATMDDQLMHFLKKVFPASFNSSVAMETAEDISWLLIDDAQLAFGCPRFWKTVMKDFASSPYNLRIVIAATFDMMHQGSTPWTFSEHYHLNDLRLTAEETEWLYDQYLGKSFAASWFSFKDTLLKLSSGHPGVLTGGIRMLLRTYNEEQNVLIEVDALQYLRGERFFVDLRRCFPRKTVMDDAQRQSVTLARMNGPLPSGSFVDTSNGSEPLAQLVRAGVLSGDGTFTCPLAKSLYYNTFYRRPTTAPKSLDELIHLSVGSMSALRLSQASGLRKLPKEAAFQQLFNEAMTLLLPPNVAVHPELNTFANDSSGNIVSGELDFYHFGARRQSLTGFKFRTCLCVCLSVCTWDIKF